MAAPQTDDATLVAQSIAGDREAFGLLVDRHFGLVYSIALSHLRDRDLAEDLTQEVFLRAFLLLKGLSAQERFVAWMAQVARNLAVDWIRRGQRSSRLLPMVPMDTTHADVADRRNSDAREMLDNTRQSQALDQALRRLNAAERELVVMHYVEGLSHRDIASRLGTHQSTVSRHLGRALHHMRGLLEPMLRESGAALRSGPAVRARTAAMLSIVAGMSASAQSVVATAAAQLPAAAPVPKASLLASLQTGTGIMASAKTWMGTGALAAALLAGGGAYHYFGDTGPARPTAATVALASGDTLSFAPRFKPGMRMVVQTRMTMNSALQFSGTSNQAPGGIDQKFAFTKESAFRVLDAKPDGTARIEMEWLSGAMSMQMPGLTLDVATSEPAGARATGAMAAAEAPAREVLKSLVGTRVTATLDASGNVTALEGTEAITNTLKAVSNPAVAMLLTQLLTDEACKTEFEALTLKGRPAGPAAVGSQWEDTQKFNFPQAGSMDVVSRFRFKGWEMLANRRVAAVEMDVKTGQVPGSTAPGVPRLNMDNLKCRGTCYVDPDLGITRHSVVSSGGVMDMDLPAFGNRKASKARIQVDSTVESSLTEISGT